MTGLQSLLENYFPCDWTDPVHSEHSPVSLSISSPQYFSPVAGLMPVHRPSKKRRALDHFSDRLECCGLPGSDHAIEYLHEKYSDCQITLIDNTDVGATFEVDPAAQKKLTVIKEGSGTGSILSVPIGILCGSICSADFAPSTDVTLLATADKGSKFMGWSGDVGGACPPPETDTCTVTMDQARDIQADFYYFPWTMFLPAIINNAQP